MKKRMQRGKKGGGGHPSPITLSRRILEAAKRGETAPVYLFHGDEQYMLEETVRGLIETLLPEEQRAFGLEVLHGPAVSSSELSEALGGLPLFGGGRVVWLKRCGLVRPSKKADGTVNLSQRAATVRGLLPEENTGVTVIISEQEIDRRLALYKDIEKRGVAREFAALSDSNNIHLKSIHEIVTERLKADGKEITRDTLFYLIQLVGTDLLGLLTEVEKLSLYAAGRRKISREDIDTLVIPTRETVAYQLADAVTSRDLPTALSLLRGILGQGGKPLMVLAMLLKRLRYLLQAKALMEAGAIRASLLNAPYAAFKDVPGKLPESMRGAFSRKKKKGFNLLHEHPYVVFKMCQAARRMQMQRLQDQLQRVVSVDKELKGGRRSKAHALEDLIIRLCS